MSFGVNLENFKNLAAKQGMVTNYREILDDIDTPVSVYAKLQMKSADTFLFESVIGGEKIGRYSFIGYKALEILKSYAGDPYEMLSLRLDQINKGSTQISKELPFFHQGFVGYFSFETIKYIEPSIVMQRSDYPEAYLILVGSMVVFDHVMHKIYLISNSLIDDKTKLDDIYQNSIIELDEIEALIRTESSLDRLDINLTKDSSQIDPQASGFISNTGNEAYKQMVEISKTHIKEGDIFQVVPSHKLRKDIQVDPLKAYRILRSVNPSPYLFLFNLTLKDLATVSLVGSSPEMIVKSSFKEGGLEAEVRPIAGTYARGASDAEDTKLAAKLLNDTKEIAEHIMLIDLARNDLGRVCENGSIKVPQNMIIEKYSHVLHIVSSVTGRIKSDLGYKSGIELMKACFPAGTLSGAPKVEAIKIISALEKEARGLYGGGIGYFGLDGMVDVAIMIRTMIIEANTVTLQAGGGVVADSDPVKELQETYNKAGALIKVINLATDLVI